MGEPSCNDLDPMEIARAAVRQELKVLSDSNKANFDLLGCLVRLLIEKGIVAPAEVVGWLDRLSATNLCSDVEVAIAQAPLQSKN